MLAGGVRILEGSFQGELMQFDWQLFLSLLAATLTIIGFIVTFFVSIKKSIHKDIIRIEKRLEVHDERMFQLATGKSLADAILDERKKERK